MSPCSVWEFASFDQFSGQMNNTSAKYQTKLVVFSSQL